MTLEELAPRQGEAIRAALSALRAAPSQLRVFQHLLEHSPAPHQHPEVGREQRKSLAVAEACGFPGDDEKARGYIRRTRSGLHRFMRSSEARDLSYVVRIRVHDHGVVLNGSGLYLRKLWHPYIAGALRRTASASAQFDSPALRTANLMYVENLFLRAPHERQEFVRRFDINDLTAYENAKRAGSIRADLVPRRHYVSSGVMKCCLDLTRLLANFTVRVKYFAREEPNWRSRETPLVLIGNARTNPLFTEIQNWRALPIQLLFDGISIQEPSGAEVPLYVDDLNEGGSVYGLVTRILGPRGQAITMVGANHGHTFFALSRLLTQNLELKPLFDQLGLGEADECPKEFQIVFRMAVTQEQRSGEHEMPGPIEYVTSRRLDPAVS